MRSDLVIPAAILIGAAIIGLAVVGAQLVAPYRAVARPDGIWRLNIVTGEARGCIRELNTERDGFYCRW